MAILSVCGRVGSAVLVLLSCCLRGGPACAQPPPNFLQAKASAPATVQAGTPFDIVVVLEIAPGFHIQSNPTTEFYIPTVVQAGAVKGLTASKPVYPKATRATLQGEKLSVYQGTVRIKLRIMPAGGMKPGRVTLPIRIHYQGCNDRLCYRPADIRTAASFVINPARSVKRPASR